MVREVLQGNVALNKGPDYEGWRAKLLRVLDEPRSSTAAKAVFHVVSWTIVASMVIFYLRTVPLLNDPGSATASSLFYAELACICVFTLELGLR